MQTKGGKEVLYDIKISFTGFLWRALLNLSTFVFLPSCSSLMLAPCTKYLYFCMSTLYYWMFLEKVSILSQNLLDSWYKEGNGLICVFELLTQSPNTSDCQVRKVFSMKAILQRPNSFN